MFRLLADDPQSRFRGFALGLAAQSAVILLLANPQWFLPSGNQPEPSQTHEVLTILAPPPGKLTRTNAFSLRRSIAQKTQPGISQKIDDSTTIAFDPDDDRQLIPVLAQFHGLIVFAPVLDRTHPRAAFHPDGSSAPVPTTLDHWVRIRLANPSWWPEVEALCSTADPDGTMEAMAVFPPAWRVKLGAELKSTGHVTAITLHLETGKPAGIVISPYGIDHPNPALF
jgi:hypothetical protein